MVVIPSMKGFAAVVRLTAYYYFLRQMQSTL